MNNKIDARNASPLVKSVLQLQAVNKELAELKAGKRDKEIQEAAEKLFPAEERKAMENELKAKIAALFCNI